MCESCFDTKYFGFVNREEFNNLCKAVDNKTSTSSHLAMQRSKYRHVKVNIYKCSNCKTKWYLSVDPPRAMWRGFFLPSPERFPYIDLLIRKARIKAIILAAVFVTIILIMVFLYIRSLEGN